MADTPTTNIRAVNQTIGGNDNTWGQVINSNNDKFDAKLGNVSALALTGGTYTLTETEERVNAFNATGVLVANSTVVFSGRGGAWVFKNGTTGSFTLTVKVTGQTGVVITQGETVIIYSTGTDIAKAGGVDGALNFLSAEVTVVSASTADALGAASVFVLISGTTTITSLGTGANRLRIVRFGSALTLTHNATSLICPGAANLAMAAGDQIIIKSDASSNVRVVNVLRAGGIVAADIADKAVTYAKIQDVSATSKVLGRSTAGAGSVEEIAFTPVARTLVAQTTQALMRTTGLGLGDLAIADLADLGYAGSSAANVSYPMWSYVAVSGATSDRNESASVRLFTGNSAQYIVGGGGAGLSGIWRSRGVMSSSENTELFTRTG